MSNLFIRFVIWLSKIICYKFNFILYLGNKINHENIEQYKYQFINILNYEVGFDMIH